MGENQAKSSSHYQVSFFSNNEKYRHISDCVLSIPASSGVNQLNTLVANMLQEDSEKAVEPVEFDFLISSTFLRSTLEKFVEDSSLPVESVIRIECVVQEPAPTPLTDITLPDWVGAVKSDSTIIATTSYSGDLVIVSHSGQKLMSTKVHEGAVKCISMLPKISENEQHEFATGGHDQVLFISKTEKVGEQCVLRRTQVLRGHERSVECCAVDQEGTRLISGGFDCLLKVWNIEEGDTSTVFEKNSERKMKKQKKADLITKVPLVTLAEHKDAIVGAAWCPNSKKDVVTVSWDHSIALWDLELAGRMNTLTGKKAFTSVSAHPSSSLLITGSADSVVRQWDPRSHEGSLVKQAFIGHTGWVSSVCWNPIRSHLFISASYDWTMKMWDIRSNKTPLYDLLGHKDRILSCDWSVDDLMVSGGADCSVKAYGRNRMQA